MHETDRLGTLFVTSRTNAVLSWVFVLVLGSTALAAFAAGRYEAVLFGSVAATVVVVPAIAFGDATVMPPWYFSALICLPVLWRTVAPFGVVTTVVPPLSVAAIGLLLIVELHRFTSVTLVPWLGVVLTVLFTLAMANLLNVVRWLSDTLLGTALLLDGRSQEALNEAVMVEFLYVIVAGVLAGWLFSQYFCRVSARPDPRLVGAAPPPTETPSRAAILSERVGVSTTRRKWVVLAMQAVLAVVFLYGVWTRHPSVLVNAGGALGITFLPAILERDYGIPIAPGLALWVTSAVFLHTLGTVALYDAVVQWDSLTHTFSATIVAAAGYTTLRVVHLHTPSVHLPPWAMFGFTLVFVLAVGVVWELLEFGADLAAVRLDLGPGLAQHGIDDTVTDMLFNTVGAVLVALWGTTYLVEISDSIAVTLEKRLNE